MSEALHLGVDPIACEGHGLCYPVIEAEVPEALRAHARRAVTACPALALKLMPAIPR